MACNSHLNSYYIYNSLYKFGIFIKPAAAQHSEEITLWSMIEFGLNFGENVVFILHITLIWTLIIIILSVDFFYYYYVVLFYLSNA